MYVFCISFFLSPDGFLSACRIATGLLTAIRPPNTISPTEGTIEIIKLILEYISDTVVSQRLSYSILLRDTTLEIYQVLMENSALRLEIVCCA